MRIGLFNIEPKVVNTALVQISYHHKQRGDTVEWAEPLFYDKYDKLYCSSLFQFTDKSRVPRRAICGGTGFDLTTTLPFDGDYDYSIYPECDYSIVWFSRGCIRDCPSCVVPQKEGGIKAVDPKSLNPNGEHILIQDNNFFAHPEWYEAIKRIRKYRQPVTFQGVDVHLLSKKKCRSLMTLRHKGQIKIAWDDPRCDIIPKLEKVVLPIIKAWRIMCYVLVGYWSTKAEDLRRVLALQELGIDPFVMPYNKQDPYQKRFARWMNRLEIFNTVKWEDYTG